MKRLFSASILLLVAATAALAQIDPDPDSIGIYFDEGATVNVFAPVGGQLQTPPPVVSAYLVATRMTLAGNVFWWESAVATYSPEGGPGSAPAIWGAPRGGTNVATNLPGSARWAFSVYPGPAPLPVVQILVLADLEIMWSPPDVVPLYIHSAMVVGFGVSNPLSASSGTWNLPVAMINGEPPAAAETRRWGAVKSLFR